MATKPNPYAKFDAIVPVYGPRLMKDVGIRDFHSAAVWGSMGQESGGGTVLQEGKPWSGRGGWGWFQLTGPRRVAFEKWCKAGGRDPASDSANYDYLLIELRGPESHALELLKRTTALETATYTFAIKFERPGVLARANREKWANRALPLIRHAVMSAEAPVDHPAPVLPTKLPEPTVTPPAVPEKPDSAWARGTANMRKVFGPAPRRSA